MCVRYLCRTLHTTLDVKHQLGERVQFLRQSKGWSQAELAKRSGIERSYVSRIEGGISNIQLDTLELLADGFGIGFDQLLLGIRTTKQQEYLV